MASLIPISLWPEPDAWATREPEEFGLDGGAVAIQHWLDETRGGLWVQTFPGRYTPRELGVAHDHLDARVRAWATGSDPLGLVVDLRFARIGPVQRRRIAQSIERADRAAGELVRGQAFIVRTALQRGALTATFWLARPRWPIKVFTDRLTAVAWMAEQMFAGDAAPTGG